MANPSIVVEYIANIEKLTAGAKEIGKVGQDASKGWDFKKVAAWGAAAGAAVAAGKLIKDSVTHVTDLAKATMSLQRATNMDTQTASAWIEVLKLRNISADQFQTSLNKTAKLMDKSRLAQEKLAQTTKLYNEEAAYLQPIIDKGGEAGKEATKAMRQWDGMLMKAQSTAAKANEPFTRLGISLEAVRKGDVSQVLLQAADGFQKITNPATRAALAQQLFGRQGTRLLPILMKGAAGVQELLKHVTKLGATIGDKTVKNVAELTAAQRDLKTIQDGIKVQIGSALVPAQVELYTWLLKLLNLIIPFTHNADVMKGVLIAVAVAMGILKVATIASTLAQAGLTVANIKAAASWLLQAVGINAVNVSLGVALLTFGAIVVAIAAVIVIGILLYKNWDKISKVAGQVWGAIRKGAVDALNWLKRNWPLILGILLGPFALAVALIYKNWDAIVSGARAAGTRVKNAITGALSGIGAAVWGVINNIGAVLTQYATQIANWGTNVGAKIRNAVVGALTGIGGRAWEIVNNIGAVIVQKVKTIEGWGTTIGAAVKRGFESGIAGLTAIFKGAINAVLRLWNSLKFPKIKIKGPGPLPDFTLGGFKVPQIPLLAQGGIVTGPTLAMLGERGPEAVMPLGQGGAPVEVRVFIGETELRGLVKSEVRVANNRTAQVLLAGAR